MKHVFAILFILISFCSFSQTAITEEQRIELEASPRFQAVSQQFIQDRAIYLTGLNGTTGNLAGLTPEGWARQRYIAKGIVLHPNSQSYADWISQFSLFLKGQSVWSTDVDGTITGMISSGKFEELSGLAYALRASVLEF